MTTSAGTLTVAASGDVYVTGTENFVACYWKNGVKNNLFGGTNSTPRGIAILYN
jgi:hypothetical protein